MSEIKTWFKSGYGSDNFPERDTSKSADYGPITPTRFWLRVGEDRRIMFVEDNPFHFVEHEVWLEGKNGGKGRMEHVTCLALAELDCPFCAAALEQPENEFTVRAKPVAAYTIIDFTPWTSNKTGKVYNYSKRLLVATEAPYRTLKTLHNNRVSVEKADGIENSEGLKFHKYIVTRNKNKDPRVGGMYEHWKKINNPLTDLTDTEGKPLNISETDLQPFDYETAFALKTPGEVKALCDEWLVTKGRGPVSAVSETGTGTETNITY